MQVRKTLLGSIGQRLDYAFREREVILRADGRVTYFKISSRLQKLSASAIVLMALVPMFSGLAAIHQGRELSASSEALDLYRQAYVSILSETRSYHEAFAGRMGEGAVADGSSDETVGLVDRALVAREALRNQLLASEAVMDRVSTQDAEAKALTARLRELLVPNDGEGQNTAEARHRIDLHLHEVESEAAALRKNKQILEEDLFSLGSKLQRSRSQIASLEAGLARSNAAVEDLESQVRAQALHEEELDDRLALTQETLETTQNNIASLEAGLARSNAKVEDLESQVRAQALHEEELDDRLALTQETLDTTQNNYEQLELQREFLLGRVAKLSGQLEEIGSTQEAVVDRLSEQTSNSIAAIEDVLTMTGIDLPGLLAEPDFNFENLAQGGPFIPGDYLADDDPAVSLKASVTVLDMQLDRWESLQDLARSLPLTAPLKQYRVTSKFGVRQDPVNNKQSAHYGIDLAAPMRTPVLSTAPGRVVFAGWKGRYGRVIEIEHGYGIRTLYGHLKKILVEPGQTVGHREKIGLLGSSGRSTGPHVHYEVVINGKPYNPLSMLDAGLYFYKGDRS